MGLNVSTGRPTDIDFTISTSISGEFIEEYYKSLCSNENTNINEIEYLNIGLYAREMPDFSLIGNTIKVDLINDGNKYSFIHSGRTPDDAVDNDLPYSIQFKDYFYPINERIVSSVNDNDLSEVDLFYRIGFSNLSTNLYGEINSINLFYPDSVELEEMYLSDKYFIYDMSGCEKINYSQTDIKNDSTNSSLKGFIFKNIVFEDSVVLAPHHNKNAESNTKYIYIKYKLKNTLEEIVEKDIGISICSEISSYSVFSDENYTKPYLAYDRTSTPNNYVEGVFDEDDGDPRSEKFIDKGGDGFKVQLRTELHGDPDVHTYTPIIKKQPTCDEPGIRKYKCKCGDFYTEEIPALGHKWSDWEVTKFATEDEEGTETRECSVCHTKENKEIPKIKKATSSYEYESSSSRIIGGTNSKKSESSSSRPDVSSKADNSSKADTSSKMPDSSSAADKAKDDSSKADDKTTTPEEDKPVIKGDANGDTEINVADIAVTAAHIKGIKALNEAQELSADVNGDKSVNVTDIAMIASHIKGIKALS